ncbi:HSP20 domain-containing protein [Cephalotus follicularis]|uniref:HSP20 domain-containing protein n=1 Tax=Cephalotus follicularis TaxID=3775 RepID=A0A1Q3CAP7_CEPFO|nr:HSP20 domain-containing protein [Cephalotus follicularis]
MATKAAATSIRSYEDFEPFCKWQGDQEQDTLEVHLYGFKKEQLKVQINNKGLLTITGERPLDATRINRFRKETNVSKDCDTSKIGAKFSGGILYITLPKRTPPVPVPQEKQKPEPKTDQDDQVIKDSAITKHQSGAKEDVTTTQDATLPMKSDAKEDVTTTTQNATLPMKKLGNYVTGIKSSLSNLKMDKKKSMRVVVAAAVVVMVALGAYTIFKYRKTDKKLV